MNGCYERVEVAIPARRRCPVVRDIRHLPDIVSAAQEADVVHLEAGCARIDGRFPVELSAVLGNARIAAEPTHARCGGVEAAREKAAVGKRAVRALVVARARIAVGTGFACVECTVAVSDGTRDTSGNNAWVGPCATSAGASTHSRSDITQERRREETVGLRTETGGKLTWSSRPEAGAYDLTAEPRKTL